MTGVGTAIGGRRKRNIEKGERDSGVMIFVTVEGLEKNNSFILESTFGDTSTSEFSIIIFIRFFMHMLVIPSMNIATDC